MGYNITKEEAKEVYSLVKRAVPSANGTEGSEHAIDEWSDEEKALFVKATEASYHLWYRGNFLICDALKPLNSYQIRFLLSEIVDEDGIGCLALSGLTTECVKAWYSDDKSLDALSSEMTHEELIDIRDEFFGGLDEWLKFTFDIRQRGRGAHGTMQREVLRSDDALLPITFPDEGIVPLRYFAQTVRVWGEYKLNPNLYDIVVKSARHHLCQAGEASLPITAKLAVEIVQGALFDCSEDKPPRHSIARATLLEAIYKPEAGPVYQPTPDAWMTLIFTEAHNVCNADQNEPQEADDDEHGVYEMIFCDSCENDLDDIGRACRCTHTRLHVEICRFLMAKDVPIPREVWQRLAYHNQWRLAHYLHTHKPIQFNLNIPISALNKAVEYDRVGFVKFLLQYGYFEATDVPPGADLSTKMRECLGTGTRKRRRDALVSAQSALDELKGEMPEGVYLKLCTSFQTAFNQ